MTSPIGRRSSFSKEQQNLVHEIKPSENKAYKKGLIVDVCDIAKPESKYLPGKVFDLGVTFIFVTYSNFNIYAVAWKGSAGELLGNHGTHANIIGRDITVIAEDDSDHRIFEGEIILDANRRSENYNLSVPEFKSMSFFGNLYTDYESQLKANKLNIKGKGEIPLRFKGDIQ